MSIKAKIYASLDGKPPKTVYEIARAVNRPYSTWLRRKVEEMVRAGDLKRVKRTPNGGRPAFVYSIAQKRGSFRRQWLAERERGYPFTYEMWLEAQLEDCLDGDG